MFVIWIHATFQHYFELLDSVTENIEIKDKALWHISYQDISSEAPLKYTGTFNSSNTTNTTLGSYYKNTVKLIYDDSLASKLEAVKCSVAIMSKNKVLNITRTTTFKNDRIDLLWLE